MLEKIQRKTARFVSDISYRLALLNHAKKLPKLSQQDQRILDALHHDGGYITSLEQLGFSSTPQLLAAADRYLSIMESAIPTENGKVKNSNGQPTLPQIYTVTDLDEFHRWGVEPRLLNIVENYIGLPVEFQGVHLRRDFANASPVTTEYWHKDIEDRRVVKIFLYLVDVDERRGPFEYIPRSAVSKVAALRVWFKTRLANRKGILGLSNEELSNIVPRSTWKPCPGPAGTVVIADTESVLHHGKNREMCRSALFFVYTAKNPLRPHCCTQYRDLTFARPDVLEKAQSPA